MKLNKLIYKKDFFPLLVILIFVFLTQFSSINREVIDWDESTFYIISKYLINGEILYVDYWDGKPPMMFLYLAFFFKFFGTNLLVGRLAGDLLIVFSSIVIFKILQKRFSLSISLSSSLLLIYLFSYDASQPTMTEHLGNIFILYVMYLILNKKDRLDYYYLGLLFSLAFNTRNNLAFTCLGIFIFLIFENKIQIDSFIKIALGFLTPILIFSLYFFTVGGLKNYFYMLFEFPIQNTTNRYSFDELKLDIYNKLNLDKIFSIELLISLVVLISLVYFFKSSSKLKQNPLFFLNTILFTSTLLSILAGGRLYGHYLIQVFPYIAIYFALIMNILSKINHSNKLFITFSLIINLNLMYSGILNLLNYDEIKQNYPLGEITRYIENTVPEGSDLLVLDNHLIYLYTNKFNSPSIVHPSNQPDIKRNALFLYSLSKLNVVNFQAFEKRIEENPENILCELYCNEVLSEKFYNKYEIEFQINEIKFYRLIQKNN